MTPRFDPVLFWNSVFDKGLLAMIVIVAGYVANRYLERFRGQLALQNEAAKLRLGRIAELWEELSLWERDAKRQFLHFNRIALAECRAASLPGIPEPTDEESPTKVLMGLGNIQLPRAVQDKISAQVLPGTNELAERARELGRKMDRYRFWLKDELYGSMKRYLIEMQRAATLLELTPEGMASGKQAFKSLDDARHDVESVIEALLKPKIK
jgi:hypothetical protein